MTKRRRIALLTTSVLAGIGIAAGSLTVANAGEEQKRTAKVDYELTGGAGYAASVCIGLTDDEPTVKNGDFWLEEMPDGEIIDYLNLGRSCDKDVTISQTGILNVDVPDQYAGKTVYAVVMARGNSVYEPMKFKDEKGDDVGRDYFYVKLEPNSGDVMQCVQMRGPIGSPSIHKEVC